ncbi:sporulation protein YhbH [Sulfobacillus acidophilus TPY]|uniref:Sporulation protein YhbH n=1 Tax=Sulfobacillus acidophilus (strain ATCC 700253 / DSM 10332 / NAL) TaxID=679936 RepID=G8TWK3_SULAD|nr:sporulation protein YhbH [Sulfobacillus acidophilus TPY]AEW05992.1 protein of unknown function DUF444 [Sulfobacillus acidophilus DSM 10332]
MRRYSVSDTPRHEWNVAADQRRHRAKVEEAIRQHLADMVADEKIVMSDGQKTLAVPIPEFSEFRIRFERQGQESVGHRLDTPGEGDGPGTPGQGNQGTKEGGSTPGIDVEETLITLEDVQRAVFDNLALPDLDLNKPAPGAGMDYTPVTVARTGIRSQWDKRRTLKNYLLRRQKAGGEVTGGLIADDLRFRLSEPVHQEQGGAVVIAMMDTSGSMGSFEKYLAKSFFFWTQAFLRQKYPAVDMVFLAHDVRAREVDEDSFFHRGASGGTVSSSVYRLALEVVETRYPPDRFNVYAFHFTDGGNLTSDNGLAVETGSRLSQMVTLFGYGEIHDTERNPSPLYQEFMRLNNVGVVILRTKEDIFKAMLAFFGPKGEVRHA